MRNRATILVAVYGTLRPGGELYPKIRSSIEDYTLSAIRGALFVHRSGKFPVADLNGWQDTVVTTTMTMRLTPQVLDIFQLELSSGFIPVWMDELTRETHEPTGRIVLAFDFDRSIYPSVVGDRIPSGDWWTYIDSVTAALPDIH